MRYRSTSLGIFFAILASSTWAGLIHPAAAQDAPVTMTIGFGAGERPDLYGRILGRSLVRFLPGLDLVRASVGAWTSEEDLDRLVNAAAAR